MGKFEYSIYHPYAQTKARGTSSTEKRENIESYRWTLSEISFSFLVSDALEIALYSKT